MEARPDGEGVSFPQLPAHIVERILGLLSYGEVAAMRGLCRRLMECCGRTLRTGMRRLQGDIFRELLALQRELLAHTGPDTVLLRVPLLRCYNVLEVLRAEHRLLRALCRLVLLREDQCFPAGRLLDQYYDILNKVKARDIPYWSVDNDVTSGLLQLSKKFLDAFAADERGEAGDPRLGVRVVDLLDALLAVDYTLTVTYDSARRACHLVGEYELCDAKFLCLPPDIPTVLEGHAMTPAEARTMMEYLTNIVRFNNRLCLREEQYWREMEATRRAQQQLQQQGYALSPAPRFGVISRQPRDYSLYRLCRERRVVADSVIRETYREHGSRKCPFKGFWCRVNLTCPLDDAPFELMDNWKRLSVRIFAGKDLEFARSCDDLNVKIRAFLELPQTNTDCSLAFTNIDREDEVGVHGRGSHHSQDTPRVASSAAPRESSTSARLEQYSMFVEFRVSIPMRGFETEVYKVCFRDGD